MGLDISFKYRLIRFKLTAAGGGVLNVLITNYTNKDRKDLQMSNIQIIVLFIRFL